MADHMSMIVFLLYTRTDDEGLNAQTLYIFLNIKRDMPLASR